MTPLQNDILTVLRINPTPLMTAADIATKLNEWPGPRRNSLGVGSAASAIGKPLVERKWIWDGRSFTMLAYNYGPGTQQYGWGTTKKRYYFLRARTEEAHLGLKQGHQRYLGCPVKYVWPLDSVTRAQFEKEYPTDG